VYHAVLLSLALVLGLELSSRTNFESLALALALKLKSLLTTLDYHVHKCQKSKVSS